MRYLCGQMGVPFTRETAQVFARRSHEARARNKLAKIQAETNPVIASQSLTQLAQDCFAGNTLKRVRKQIALVQDQMDNFLETGETKPLKELSDCLARLAEIERQLAGRPLPGSLRPKQEKPKRITAQAEPDEV